MTRDLKAFVAAATQAGAYSFDVEHHPELDCHQPGFKLHGVGFATEGMSFYEQDMDSVRYLIGELFKLPLEAIAYNGKYDLKCLMAVGMTDPYRYPEFVCDPMVEVNLLDENRHPGDLGLKTVIWDQYGYKMSDFKSVYAAFGLDSPEFEKYALDDAEWEYRLHKDLKPKVIEEDLWQPFSKILMPMLKLAADMEWVGIGWDLQNSKGLLRGYQLLRAQLEDEITAEIGQLNLGSGDQLAKRLFEDLGFSTRGIDMTDSGKRYSTDAKAMETLAKKYPVCLKICKYRTADKMISTYVEPLSRMCMADKFNRIHPTIWLVSATGRTRMEKPNFQNIPSYLDKEFSHLSIRQGVVPPKGWKLIDADLSQIELRLCGHVSMDPTFLAAYRNWTCTVCNTKGSEISKLHHKCPNCGAAEDENILKCCPICKTQHVKPLKQKVHGEEIVIGCRVCINKEPFESVKIKGFWHGEDLHQQTTDAVTALEGDRQMGKTCNFALIYYATAMRLHYEFPKFSIAQWEEISYQYFRKYQGVKRWHLQMEQLLHHGGVTRDLFGRKRRISKRDIAKSPKHALNQFINYPVQASACEYIQLCMSNLRKKWISEGVWMREIYQSNFVHDEGVWECPAELVPKFVPDIVHAMENSVAFQVPIRTSIKILDNWGQAKS
jgi:DNA polymerase-1